MLILNLQWFKNNYDELKKIFNDIGLQYDDSIFDNSKFSNVIVNGQKIVEKKNLKILITEHIELVK